MEMGHDMVAEVDMILRTGGHQCLESDSGGYGIKICGYEIETHGAVAHIYHRLNSGRSNFLHDVCPYADTLRDAGYACVEIREETYIRAAHVVVTPKSFHPGLSRFNAPSVRENK